MEGGVHKADKTEFQECISLTWRQPYILQLAFSAGIRGFLFGYDTDHCQVCDFVSSIADFLLDCLRRRRQPRQWLDRGPRTSGSNSDECIHWRASGFSISGLLMHAIGSQGVLGMLSLPAALVFSVEMVMREPHAPNFAYTPVHQKLMYVNRTMWAALKCPDVWRPCIFMFASLALSLNIQEGMFYWYTDLDSGPHFSQGTISFIFSVGSVGSLLGVLLYQKFLKDSPFRPLLFWTQLLSILVGMLDLALALRLNLRIGASDRLFVMMDESVSQMIERIKWMPLLVLSSKLCPSGSHSRLPNGEFLQQVVIL